MSSGRVSLSTSSCYPESLTAGFEIAARLGYDGVEIKVMGDPLSQDAQAIARLSRHYGVPVVGVHAPTLLISQRVWGDPWQKLERSREMAQTLGASTVVLHPPFLWQGDYAAGFAEGIARLEAESGVVFAVENMYPWRVGRRVLPAYAPDWDPVQQPYDHVTLDFSHAATAGQDALELARALGPRLVHVHLGDGSGSARDEHLAPGDGNQPCAATLEWLADAGWRGEVVVEVTTRRARDRHEREELLARSLAFARLHLGGVS
ncbi:MAG: sugar phosphate isomerase/epimerase family protein [Actinomycetales bacterium]